MPPEEEVRRRCIIDPSSCSPPPQSALSLDDAQVLALADEIRTAEPLVPTGVAERIAVHLLKHFVLKGAKGQPEESAG